MFNVGDQIDYTPRAIASDNPVQNCTVRIFEPRGSIFNQPMVSIDEVPYWIPAYDCTLSQSNE